MAELVLFHNPRCSKSRAALALLTDRGVEVDVVRYLDSPPTRAELREVIDGLDGSPRMLVRTGEVAFAESGVDRATLDDPDVVADLLAQHPSLIERPVLISGTQAVIGRPPERVLELLEP